MGCHGGEIVQPVAGPGFGRRIVLAPIRLMFNFFHSSHHKLSSLYKSTRRVHITLQYRESKLEKK
jgi:hypothetical protein